MTAVPSIIRLNSTLPAAPSGYMNVKPQHDGNFPIDDTSFYIPNLGGKDPRTTTSETIGIASQGKLVTLTNAGAIAVTLDSTVWNQFFCAVQVDGAGAATFTPSSGLINGVASAPIAGGSNLGGWLFFDGTNWWMLTGGGGGSSSPLTTKGDLYTHSTVDVRLAVGADKTILMADSSQTTGLGWKTARGNTFVPQLADSTSNPTTGDLAGFDANGNVNDSGILGSSVPTKVGVQNQSYCYVIDSGAANAYVVTPSPAVTSYVAGLRLAVKIANTNTGASTINVSSLGTKNIKIYKNDALADPAAGDLAANDIVDVTYDGTQFQVDGSISQQPWDVLFNPNLVMGSGAIFDIAVMVRPVTFPGNFVGSQGHCRVNPGTTQTITVNKNGSGIGTIVITSGGSFSFTTTGGAAQSFAAGDYMSFTNQGAADASMQMQCTLTGTR